MTPILALAAFAVDVSLWPVTRHQAQMAADAAALAAAELPSPNCLATRACTSTTGRVTVRRLDARSRAAAGGSEPVSGPEATRAARSSSEISAGCADRGR